MNELFSQDKVTAKFMPSHRVEGTVDEDLKRNGGSQAEHIDDISRV